MCNHKVVRILTALITLGAAIGCIFVLIKKFKCESPDEDFLDDDEDFDDAKSFTPTKRNYTTLTGDAADAGQETEAIEEDSVAQSDETTEE